jgi:3-deoxy-D-manno-octulosonic-acid transferase
MKFIYTIVFQFLNFLLPLGKYSISAKVKLFASGRLNQNLDQLPIKIGLRYWFHCASLGEFEQAKPIIEKLKNNDVNCTVVVTFFSPSGYLYAKSYKLVDAILYLPLDTKSNAQKLVFNIQADKVFFIKYDLWYHLLNTLFENNIPTYLVSAVFREKQFLFNPFGSFIFELLPQFKSIFLQDQKSFDLLKSRDLNNIVLTGDTRYDRVISNRQNVKLNDTLEHFRNHQPLIILGSSWEEEEDLMLRFLKNNPNINVKVIIAPHDITVKHINEIFKKFSAYSPILFTNFTDESSISNLMILNTIGHLASAYYYADLAIVGGGFGRGLHNILEPLAFDVPVVFGPKTSKYPEAQKAIEAQVAFQISDYISFEFALNHLILSKPVNKSSD